MLDTPLPGSNTVLMLVTLVLVVEHVVPTLHKYLSWDVDDLDLGPILPVRW